MSGTYGDDLPWRFFLRDLEGQFPDYKFEINPTTYKPMVVNERYGEHFSLAGNRKLIKFNRQIEARDLNWERIHRNMYQQLRDRFKSGNTFYLFDHNKIDIVGIITDFSFDEIVATVPSDYKGSLKIQGVGKPEARDYNYYGE